MGILGQTCLLKETFPSIAVSAVWPFISKTINMTIGTLKHVVLSMMEITIGQFISECISFNHRKSMRVNLINILEFYF